VYDPITGKAYPNPAAALSAGVKNFSYQIPAGMNVDWSYWDQFRQPPPPPRPAPMQTVPVRNQTIPFTHAPATGQAQSPAPQPETSAPEPFQMTDEAKRFAAAGMMGRASSAVKAAGGVWTKDMHRQLRKDAEGKKDYGGDFANQSDIDDMVNKYGVMDASPGGGVRKKVQMGKAKRDWEKKHGKGSWNKDVHVAIAASAQRDHRQSQTKRKPKDGSKYI